MRTYIHTCIHAYTHATHARTHARARARTRTHTHKGCPRSFTTFSVLQSKSPGKSANFLWLILNVLLFTTAPRSRTLSRACAGCRQNGVVWCCDVLSKQWIVITFLSAEKKSVMNVHKRLELCAVPVLLINALLLVGLYVLQVLRKAKRRSLTRVAITTIFWNAKWVIW